MTSLFYGYNQNIDQQNIFATNRELVSLLDLDASGDSVDPENIPYNVAASWPGASTQTVDTLFESLEKQYSSMLQQVQIINKLSNLTNFANATFDSEKARMSTLRDKTVNDVYKMRSGYMNTQWRIGYDQYVIGILQFTLIMTCFATILLGFLVADQMNAWLAGSLVGILVIIYLVALIITYRSMVRRRKDDWSKFYFSAPTV
jgi:hypothetical protein